MGTRFGREHQDGVVGVGEVEDAQVHVVKNRRKWFGSGRGPAGAGGRSLWRGGNRSGELSGGKFKYLGAVCRFVSGPEVEVVRTRLGTGGIGNRWNDDDLGGTGTVLGGLGRRCIIVEVLNNLATSRWIGLAASQDGPVWVFDGRKRLLDFHGFLRLRRWCRRSGFFHRRRFRRLGIATVQARWRIFVFDVGSLVLLASFWRLGAGGQPRAFGHPDVAGLSGLGDGEDALRYAGSKSFIDNTEVECHGNGSAFVRSGVEKLAVHGDGDRNQVRLAIGKKLNQSESARSF